MHGQQNIYIYIHTRSVFTGLTEPYRITLTSVELICLYHWAVYNFFVVA